MRRASYLLVALLLDIAVGVASLSPSFAILQPVANAFIGTKIARRMLQAQERSSINDEVEHIGGLATRKDLLVECQA
jgi:hypothetical protein